MSIQMWSMSFASVVTVFALLFGSAPAEAQGSAMSVIITDKPDPASTLANVTYTIKAKNTWNKKATGVVVNIPIPAGTQFVSCTSSPKKPCALAGNTLTMTVGDLGASSQVIITLVLKMPSGTGPVSLNVSAQGSNVGSGSGQTTTTVQTGGGDPRGALVVGGSDSPDPAAAGGQVTYAFTVKNNSTTGATNVVVTIPVPGDVGFSKCSVSPKVVQQFTRTCTPSASVGGTVTATIGPMPAHSTAKISLAAIMPSVSTTTSRTLAGNANGDGVSDGSASVTTSILAGGAPVVFQPSGRQGTVSCGGTVGFQAGENIVQFEGGLGCASLGGAAAVTIATPNVTVNLAGFKIVGAALPANIGNIGIYVAASGVTINGGGTGSGNGIESFDFGVLDWGAAPGLTINTLRIFRARSIGIRTSSDGVALTGVLIDRSAAATNATSWLPGGLGIYASGNITVTDAIVRRSSTLGIWIAGDATHVGANGRVATITGSNSRVEANLDRGIWVDNGPHTIKDVHVTADGIGGASTWGVVINSTGTQVELDGVIVQSYAGWGVVDAGTGSKISRSSVDKTVANGFALNGTGANVSGNTAQAAGYGFAVNGSGSVLTSNTAQFTQNGFAISGTGHQLSSNQSKQNTGIGFWVGGTSNTFTSNSAELNDGAEWNIGPNNVDGGGNEANGSTFTFDAAGLIVN